MWSLFRNGLLDYSKKNHPCKIFKRWLLNPDTNTILQLPIILNKLYMCLFKIYMDIILNKPPKRVIEIKLPGLGTHVRVAVIANFSLWNLLIPRQLISDIKFTCFIFVSDYRYVAHKLHIVLYERLWTN